MSDLNLPKGPGSWPKMEQPRRQEVYEKLLALKGESYKAGRENLATDILKKVSDPSNNYSTFDVLKKDGKSIYNDKLVGKHPVSAVILKAFTQGKAENPKALMHYSLDYLVSGNENKSLALNIDKIQPGDSIVVGLDAQGRWVLSVGRMVNGQAEVIMSGHLFPPNQVETSDVPAERSGSEVKSELKFKERNEGENEYSIRVDDKPGALLPESNEYLEVADAKLFAESLIGDYDSMGIEPFLQGLDGLTEASRNEVLTESFNLLGKRSPEEAYKLMQAIIENEHKNNFQALTDEMDRLAIDADKAGKKSESTFWMLQKVLALGGAELGIDTMQNIYKRISMIDKNDLPEDLKKMLEENEKTLDLFMKRSLALDMIASSASQASGTFTDMEGLAELQKMDRTALSQELENGWSDNDADVFLANAHVNEVLRLLVAYQYPKDLLAGKKIQNPISYYYEQLENGSIQTVEIPNGVFETVKDPLNNGNSYPDGGVLDLSQYFVNREAELRIFDEYQRGAETLGDGSIWSGYAGKGAFMGNEAINGSVGQTIRGLIHGSDQLFTRPIFETNGELGAVEQLYLEKIKESVKLGRYDEARDLCVQLLETELKGKKTISDKDIDAKTNEMWTDWKTSIEAQVTLDLDAKGVTDADAQKIPNGAGGFYRDRADFINATAREVVKGKAYLELQSEPAEALYNDAAAKGKLNGLQKAALEELAELNGYGSFDLKAENYDFAVDIAKTVTEITVTSVALSATGGLAAGALGATRLGATTMALRGMEAGRALNAGERAFVAGQRFNTYIAGTRLGARALAIPGLRTAAGAVTAGTETLATGTGYGAALSRGFLNSVGFVESLRAMHGDSLNIANAEGAWEVGSTAMTLGVLHGSQSFIRGGMQGTRLIGGLSERIGGLNARLRSYGSLGFAGANTVEMAAEVGVMKGLAKAQTELAVASGMLTRTQAEAMEHPDYSEWGHLAGVVLGLRTWRMGAEVMKQKHAYYEGTRLEDRIRTLQEKGIELNPVKNENILKEDGTSISPTERAILDELPKSAARRLIEDAPKIKKHVDALKAKGVDPEKVLIDREGDGIKVTGRAEPVEEAIVTAAKEYFDSLAPEEKTEFLELFADSVTNSYWTEEVHGVSGIRRSDLYLLRLKSKGVDLERMRYQADRFLDKNGNEVKRDVERERTTLRRYLDSLSKDEVQNLEQVKNSMSPMKESCRVAVNIPAYKEGARIYDTLRRYSTQVDETGKPLNPDLFELNVIVNREASVAGDNTLEEVMRFKRDYPAVNVNAVEIVFPNGEGGVGAARKVITDATLSRSLDRSQKNALYIQSEDADLVEVDPRTITGIVGKMDAKPYLDALRGRQDRNPELMMQNDGFFLMRRMDDFAEILMRAMRFRPHNNENANSTWNRIVTGGWNTAITAEAYAEVGGYNPKMRVGEDMYLGQMISVLRGHNEGGKFIEETRTVETISTTSSSSPRRYLISAVERSGTYDDFGNQAREDAVRAKNDQELIEALADIQKINMENRGRIEDHLNYLIEGFLRASTPNIGEAQRLMNRLMIFSGFRPGDYTIDVTEQGTLKVKINDTTNLENTLKRYRENPKHRRGWQIENPANTSPLKDIFEVPTGEADLARDLKDGFGNVILSKLSEEESGFGLKDVAELARFRDDARLNGIKKILGRLMTDKEDATVAEIQTTFQRLKADTAISSQKDNGIFLDQVEKVIGILTII